MKRTQYIVILVAAVLAVVALAWPDNKSAPSGIARIVDVPVEQVEAIVVESAAGRAQLANRGDSDWIAQKGTPSIGSTIMFDAEKRLFPLLGYRTLDDVDPEAKEFGLNDPEIVLSIKTRSGKVYKVAYGAQTFNTGGFYARRLDRDEVYLVPRRPMDDLRSIVAGKRIDTQNIVDQKLLELDQKSAADTGEPDDSSWLKQALETDPAATTSTTLDTTTEKTP